MKRGSKPLFKDLGSSPLEHPPQDGEHNESEHFLFKKENKGGPYTEKISTSENKKEADLTKKPKVIYEDMGALGRYSPDKNIIELDPHYNVSVSEIIANPKKSKQKLIRRGEIYRHEKKHHEQALEEGKEEMMRRYIDDEMKALESHMDPFVHAPEHRQKKDWEVHPEVKTAKKYESINPALGEISLDRYRDYWNRRGQYVTPGTVEFEAQQAAYSRRGKPYKKFDSKTKEFK